jgi:hypothetical protein
VNRLVPRSFVVVVARAVVAVVGIAGCQPWSLVGEPCTLSPCAPGLLCIDAVCAAPPAPPPPPCVDDDECAVDGDASGRVCDEGVCRFADCAFDVQCGSRVCVGGACADPVVCLGDDDCDASAVCDDNVCRPRCLTDDECGVSLGGVGLQTCVEGRCLQRCLNDATCFGQGICEAGSCQTPQCALDDDCAAADLFCDAGRCTAFTPCALDDDCFDPNLFCDVEATPVRCAERPVCRADAECGAAALCIDAHCRPAAGCFVDADCVDADDECVASRCVRRPDCRGDDDCADGNVCAGLRCVPPPPSTAPALVTVADARGACAATGPACARALFVGERVDFVVQGFDATGRPVIGGARGDASGGVTTTVDGDTVTVVAAAAGAGSVAFGDVVVGFTVVETAAPLAILVEQPAGGPAAGVTVDVAGVVVVTGDDGLAAFDPAPVGATSVLALDGARGVVLVDDVDARIAGGGRLRLVLSSSSSSPAEATAAPLTVTVGTTGDELGPVGIGVVLPSTAGAEEADLVRLFGGAAQGQVQLPVLGAVPVTLPASFTVQATLPLVGEQTVRAAADVVAVAGPAFVFALEDRREQQDLVQLALGGDPFAVALDFAEQSEGLDAAVVPVGVLAALPLVADDADRDGDGDTLELVPDFAQAPAVATLPEVPPRERTGVKCRPSADSAARALVVVGLDLPGRFVVTGTGVVRGATGFEDAPLAESMKSVPPPAELAHARRALAVHAVYADGLRASRAVFRAAKLAAEVDLGPLLDPPEGAFVLADLPAPGDRSVVLPARPGATHVRVAVRAVVDGVPVVVDAWAAATGSLRLPPVLADTVVDEVEVYELGVDPFAVGGGGVDVARVARKAARAPGG